MVQLAPAVAMDEVTFRSDTVLSDVHLYTPNHRHLMVRLNSVGQPVFLSQFKLLWSQDSRTDSGAKGGDHGDVHTKEPPSAETGSTGSPPGSGRTQEEDDVLGEEAQGNPHDIIRIEHTMATPLEDVGKQVWRGALLLADYILFRQDLFRGCTALELGAGTGLASIIAATVARTVYCTDVGADLLAMCQRNIALNSHLAAAGVFYDDDLTDAVFKTLSRLAHRLKNACTAILSVEKRLNFTLRHLDVTCEAYDHFRSCLRALEQLADGKLRFVVEPVEASFPQLLVYERIQQLELWKIIAEPVT
uniref:Methyltransferase 22, Kin17 lysine n=1 Tax=Mandrillus leucophaeus TaxID=9568 RepID=A0A2K6A0U2_MANLE